MNRTERIAKKIITPKTDPFKSKEWLDFESKISKAEKKFGKNNEFNVKFSLQIRGNISGAVYGPSGDSLYLHGTNIYSRNLTENQKEAKAFLNTLVSFANSLKSAIDYVDKTAKELQKMVNNFPEELKNEIIFKD